MKKKVFTIKTKYAIGDKVFVIIDGQIKKTKIVDINLRFDDSVNLLKCGAVQYYTAASENEEVEETLYDTEKKAQKALKYEQGEDNE